MEKRKLKYVIIPVLLLLYVVSGFVREFIFLNINEQMRVTYYHDTDSHVDPLLRWLSRVDYSTLYYSKWPLTLFFSAYFALLGTFIIRVSFGEKTFTRLSLLVYSGTFLFSFLVYGVGAVTGHADTFYDISRFLAGLVETPAMLVILMGVFYAFRHSSKS